MGLISAVMLTKKQAVRRASETVGRFNERTEEVTCLECDGDGLAITYGECDEHIYCYRCKKKLYTQRTG